MVPLGTRVTLRATVVAHHGREGAEPVHQAIEVLLADGQRITTNLANAVVEDVAVKLEQAPSEPPLQGPHVEMLPKHSLPPYVGPLASRAPVESSNVKSVGYDAESETLEVEFKPKGELKNGDVYQYYRVPAQVHDELVTADSLGGYLAKNVKGVYLYRKLPEVEHSAPNTGEAPAAEKPKRSRAKKPAEA